MEARVTLGLCILSLSLKAEIDRLCSSHLFSCTAQKSALKQGTQKIWSKSQHVVDDLGNLGIRTTCLITDSHSRKMCTACREAKHTNCKKVRRLSSKITGFFAMLFV